MDNLFGYASTIIEFFVNSVHYLSIPRISKQSIRKETNIRCNCQCILENVKYLFNYTCLLLDILTIWIKFVTVISVKTSQNVIPYVICTLSWYVKNVRKMTQHKNTTFHRGVDRLFPFFVLQNKTIELSSTCIGKTVHKSVKPLILKTEKK